MSEHYENVKHWIRTKGAEIHALTGQRLQLSYGKVKAGQFGPVLPLANVNAIQAKMDEIKTLVNQSWPGTIIHVRCDYGPDIQFPKAVPPPPPQDPYTIPPACPIAEIEKEYYV